MSSSYLPYLYYPFKQLRKSNHPTCSWSDWHLDSFCMWYPMVLNRIILGYDYFYRTGKNKRQTISRIFLQLPTRVSRIHPLWDGLHCYSGSHETIIEFFGTRTSEDTWRISPAFQSLRIPYSNPAAYWLQTFLAKNTQSGHQYSPNNPKGILHLSVAP